MNKELLLVIETVANEKEISRDILFSAVEDAISIATKKRYNKDIKISVRIDKKTGHYKTFRQFKVISSNKIINDTNNEIYKKEAQSRGYKTNKENIKIVEKPIESIKFGRIAAMLAKQVIMQKVREEEKRLMVKKFQDKIGTVVYGEVTRTTRDLIIIDIGKDAHGILYKNELIPKENYRINDKLKSCIIDINNNTNKGYQIILSRANNKMLNALLKLEVPEIAEDLIDIINITRDPGSRSKISVKSNDKRIDPVGACVGIRGSRIQAITNELQGEKIDVVLWDDNPAQYIINSISPAEVVSIIQDEDNKAMEVAVKTEQLSQAIGKNGQNVKLASSLTGWKIKIIDEITAKEKKEKDLYKKMSIFTDILTVEKKIVKVLVEEGFTSIDEIAYIEKKEIMKIDGIDEKTAKELQEKAKTILISNELNKKNKFIDNLLTIQNMKLEWAKQLVQHNIFTINDLAELASDDLTDIISIDKKQAASLIMKAREPWLKNNN